MFFSIQNNTLFFIEKYFKVLIYLNIIYFSYKIYHSEEYNC
jgi:hypothetical protein